MQAALLLTAVQFVPIWSLAALAMPPQKRSATATNNIEYTINLFAYLVDTHNYTSLDSVFTSNAVADFATSAGYITGLPTIKQDLQKSLGSTISQHSLSTCIIKVLETDATKATAITYLQGTIFGQGNSTGQYMTTFGKYLDLLQLTESGWRIHNKTLVVTGQTGNPRLLM